MFFLFMPAGHIATALDLGNAAETKWNYGNITHRRLCYWLRIWVGVRVQYAKVNVQYENLLHDRFSGKV